MREQWTQSEDDALRKLVASAKNGSGHVSKEQWADVAAAFSKQTGSGRTGAALVRRAVRNGVFTSTGKRSRREMQSSGSRWTSAHDRILRDAVRGRVDPRRQITDPAVWASIAKAISSATGVERTLASVRSRATTKRWCKPLKGRGPVRAAAPAPRLPAPRPTKQAAAPELRRLLEALVRDAVAEAVSVEVTRQLKALFD